MKITLNKQWNELKDNWHELILTILIGFIGSIVFALLNLPLPWLLGALFTTTSATLFGLKLWIPSWLRAISLVILGALFGSSVEPNFLSNFFAWLPSMIAMFGYIILVIPLTFFYLVRLAGLDKNTAYFASAPGGLLPMTLLAEEMGGDPKLVSLLQGSRIVLTVAIIPIAFTVFGDYVPSGKAGTGGSFQNLDIFKSFVLVGISILGYLTAKIVRIPTPALIGSMTAVALFSLTDIIKVEIPDSLVALAQCVIGSSIGAMFKNIRPRMVGRVLAHGCIISVFMITFSSLIAYCTHLVSGFPLQALILSFAPGGLAEMTLVGFALGIDITFLVTHQIARYFIVTIGVPLVQKRLTKI